ncbi:MAG: PLP-dependent aminotransferase family protein [Chloroflexi bacterium]|nr:PLP-dependent aminotransferase family protein [Chloroflexota bacterium]
MPRIRTSSAPELLLAIDRTAAEPIHRQLERALRDAVRSGRLAPGSTLPSTRALAAEAGVSRGIAVEAYEQLVAEGYLESRAGGTTRVARAAAVRTTLPRPTQPLQFEVDFRPGRPDLEAFPREAWLRSLRRALSNAPAVRLGYLDGRGIPELRAELAAYLNRVRGTVADPDDIIVSTGLAQGIWLIASVLRADGARRFAVEDPSLGDSASNVALAGLEVVPIPVDEHGIRVDRLDAAGVAGVLVTPAHQYPTGRVLSPDRRAALLAWADRRDGLIVEDDYDAEYRYDREPIGALQGLRPDRVVYAGSASKVLAPGLRLGWLVAHQDLATRLAVTKKAFDQGSPAIDQLAFADFIARGELDRHLRRMRPIYRRRRDILLAALARHLPELRPVGAAAGLHILAWLPPALGPDAVVEAAAAAGIGIGSLAPGAAIGATATPGTPGGLVFGYGVIGERTIDEGVRRLAEVIDGLRDSHALAENVGAAPEGAAPLLSR